MVNQYRKAFSFIELSVVIIIVGVLLAGAIQGKKIINKSKLTTARTMSESSPVAVIDGLIFWLDASTQESMRNIAGSTDIQNGDQIQSWWDKNPNTKKKMVFSTAELDTYPTYDVDGLNGLPTLYFDGDNIDVSGNGDYLTTPNHMKVTNPKNHSIFVVLSVLDKDSHLETGILVKQGPSGLANQIAYGLLYESEDKVVKGRIAPSGGGSAIRTITPNNSFHHQKAFLISTTHDSNDIATGHKIYFNGHITPVVSGQAQSTLYQADTDLTIGRFSPESYGNARFCDCNISEVIMYNRVLTDVERKSIADYLVSKWHL